MHTTTAYQQHTFPSSRGKFPSTRYQGSKAKIADWIWNQVSHLRFDTCLDAFGGTSAISYRFKQENKAVTYNDILLSNYYTGLAIIENNFMRLTEYDIQFLLRRDESLIYPSFIETTFQNIYYTSEENRWLDQTVYNMQHLQNSYKYALAMRALCQACIIKRPYNLFHRKNLYMRTSDVKRSFGNKTSWDKPFEEWFLFFLHESNESVFDNGRQNRALHGDAFFLDNKYDLVYIDTPYISKMGTGTDYLAFYHFLEGLAQYSSWSDRIDFASKHRQFKRVASCWTNKKEIYDAFDRLFCQFSESILIVSYRSDGIPSEMEMYNLLKKHKKYVQVAHYGQYKYVLSKNFDSKEMLFVAL